MPTLREIIERNVPPHLQGYIARMVGKEGISGRDSPTGAAGPLQFTRGTGKRYGLIQGGRDLRRDPEANIKAGVTLTLDNANILRKGLGREPTNSELALAHQQGAGTAVKMLTGTGNAPAQNLRVNNVNPNLAPQAAAQQIMNYYGFDKTPGMTLNSPMFDPNRPGAFAMGAPGAVPASAGFAPPPAAPAAPAGTTLTSAPVADPTFMQKLLGADEKGGKGTPFEGIIEGLNTIKGATPTAPAQDQFLPTTGASVDARIAAQQPLAQSILSQMLQQMQARRGMK